MAASGLPQPRQGNPEDFKIGHLNIQGAITSKLLYLKYILETGNYDVFGVTEIKLPATGGSDKGHGIEIDGYTESVYPSSHGDISCRGIAIYIKDEWFNKVKVKEHVTKQKPNKQNGIEMVNVEFTSFGTETLKITFLYRPGEYENVHCLHNILGKSCEANCAIIMGDMNINWLEEREQSYIHGVQQLVTEVTRPATGTRQASGTIIDHIWITRGIINLLNSNPQNLLNQTQDIIDEMCRNHGERLNLPQILNLLHQDQLNLLHHEQLNLLGDYYQKLKNLQSVEHKVLKQHEENLDLVHEKLNHLKLKHGRYEQFTPQDRQALEDLNHQYPKDLNSLRSAQLDNLRNIDKFNQLHREDLQRLLKVGHGVDPSPNNIFYKITSQGEEVKMSDHCITWIALKRPKIQVILLG